MDSLHAAFEGKISEPDGLKFTANGTACLSFGVCTVDKKGTPTWVRCTVWKDRAEELAGQLCKGTLVYVEGALTLNEWQGQDGEKRHGLNCSAWRCEPLGKIGHSAPKRTVAPVGASSWSRPAE